MPAECSYNLLLANDVMAPLKIDILRSRNEIQCHYAGEKVVLPIVAERNDSKDTLFNDAYYVTTVGSVRGAAWIGQQPPKISLVHRPKNGRPP